MDMLDAIDAAVDGLCACGCQRPLDPDGPSAWYYNEGCQRKTMAAGHDQLVASYDVLLTFDDPHPSNCAEPYNWAADTLDWAPKQLPPANRWAWFRRLIGART